MCDLLNKFADAWKEYGDKHGPDTDEQCLNHAIRASVILVDIDNPKVFDWIRYIQDHDLQNKHNIVTCADATCHYLNNGIRENRKTYVLGTNEPYVYDFYWKTYDELNPDVFTQRNRGEGIGKWHCFRHWCEFGYKENRKTSTEQRLSVKTDASISNDANVNKGWVDELINILKKRSFYSIENVIIYLKRYELSIMKRRNQKYSDQSNRVINGDNILIVFDKDLNDELKIHTDLLQMEFKCRRIVFNESLESNVTPTCDNYLKYDIVVWQNVLNKIPQKTTNQRFIYIVHHISDLWNENQNSALKYNNHLIDMYIYVDDNVKKSFEKNVLIPKNSVVINNGCKSFFNKYYLLMNGATNKIANIFYHFFYIGGGETFLHQLNMQYDCINYVSDAHGYITYSDVVNNNTIIYSNSNELKSYLQFHNTILDHQLYWGGLANYSEIYNKFRIINIVHGHEILHKKEIQQNYLSYVPNKKKFIDNNITINNLLCFNKFITSAKDNIIYTKPTIGIVGSINKYKIPPDSIEHLSDLSKKFTIYIIGDINTETAVAYFNQIKLKCKNSDIIFVGYLNSVELQTFLRLKINIVLSISTDEICGFSLIDSMRHGIPIICRNTNTLNEVVYDTKFTFNNYKDISNIASYIIDNLKTESDNVCNYILNNSNTYLNIKVIELNKYLIKMEQHDKIPNIVHFIFGLKEQTEKFSYVYYLSIISYLFYNNPEFAFFYYSYEPVGFYWELIKDKLILIKIPANRVYSINNIVVHKYAHKADILRMELLQKYGGVYVDIDTISYKSITHLFEYDFMIGIQERNWTHPTNLYNKPIKYLLCNAIMAGKPGNKFITNWMGKYHEYLHPDKWCEASVHLPGIIYEQMLNNNECDNIYIANESLFMEPSYMDVKSIFEGNKPPSSDLLCLHHWDSYSNKYYKNINETIIRERSMYAKIVTSLNNNMNIMPFESHLTAEYNLFRQKVFKFELMQTNNVSVIIPYYYTPFNIFKNAIISILNQRHLLFLNIEVILIDDGTHECITFLKRIDEIYKLRHCIKFRVIELNTNVGVSDAISIGIKYASYDLICRFDADDIMHPDRIAFQVYKLDKINNKNVIISSHFTGFNDNLDPINYICRPGINNFNDIKLDIEDKCQLWYVCHPSVMFDKRYVKCIYPINARGLPEDLILWIYNSANDIQIIYDADILHLYRNNENNTSLKNTTNFNNWKNNMIAKLKEIHFDKDKTKAYLENTYFTNEIPYLQHIQEIHKMP